MTTGTVAAGRFPHLMLQEIHEQPAAVARTVALGSGERLFHRNGLGDRLAAVQRAELAGHGASRHAALAGRYMLEELAGVPAEVEYASEYRLRPFFDSRSALAIFLSQSGETGDTAAALRAARSSGMPTVAVVNAAGSTIEREADASIVTQASSERSIAATKSFTAQLAALFQFALHLGSARGHLPPAQRAARLDELSALPQKLEAALARGGDCRRAAEKYSSATQAMFVGHGVHYPVALEGALKLQETSYVPAIGLPLGEMKHGPAALFDGDFLLVAVVGSGGPQVRSYVLRRLGEIRPLVGAILAVAIEGDEEIARIADDVLYVPAAAELLLPILEAVPLQLLAYHWAVLAGRDVDRPRNLTKAVIGD